MRIHQVNMRAARRAGILLLLCLTAALSPVSALRAEDGPLVLGIFPRYNATETTTRYTPIADYLQQRLHRKVALLTSKDFQSFWRGIEERRYDIVQYNQYHYIRSAKTYQVIAHNKEFGKNTMAGALYVRKDSGITDLKQLRGRTVLFGGGEDAMISYIVPVYMMLQAGLKKDEIKSEFAVTPINSVIGVYNKQAEAAGSADNALGQPVIRNAINTDQLTALAVSDQLLQLPWAVKRTTSTKLREAIQAALVDLEGTEAGRNILKTALLTGIGKAQDKDYDPHRKMVRAVTGGLD